MKNFFFATVLACATAMAQETMTNSTVTSLWNAGMTESFIINAIQQYPTAFSLSGHDLQELINARVPDAVIRAMFVKGSSAGASPGGAAGGAAAGGSGTAGAAAGGRGGAPAAAQASAAIGGGGATSAAAAAPAAPARPPAATNPNETTVYFHRDAATWTEVISENVTWTRREGGVARSVRTVATAGIMRAPMKGSLFAETSRTILANPPDVVVNIPAGAAIHDFLLVPLRVDKGGRSVEVGGGSNKRDAAHRAIPFGVERLAERQYRILFPTTTGAGEYGIFNMNTIGDGVSQVEQVGKMYTFRILPSM